MSVIAHLTDVHLIEPAASRPTGLGALARRGVVAVIAQHHPPAKAHRAAWHWFDGLLDHAEMRPLLRAMAQTYVLHGHLHDPACRDDCFEGERVGAHLRRGGGDVRPRGRRR